MNLQALREKRANLIAKMRGVLDTAAKDGDRDLNPDEAKDYATMETDLEETNAHIARLETRAARTTRLESAESSLQQSAGAAASRQAPQRTIPGGDPARREFESIGEFMYAARFRPSDQRLQFVENAGGEGVDMRAEQRMDDGASGGFAIPVQFRGELMQVDQYPLSFRSRATVIPAGTPPDGAVLIPALDQSSSTNMYGGVVVQWIGEGATKPDTSAKIRQIELRPQEVAGTTKFTDKLLRNWQAAGPLITGLLQKAISATEEVAFLSGNGVAKPLGVLNSAAAIKVSRATGGQIKYADVLAMDEVLFGTDPSAFWVCSKRARTYLRQLQNPAGYYIWQEDANSKIPPTLLGHDVIVTDRCPTLGNLGDLMLINGSNYLIKDGSGPFVAFSEHVYFTTNETVCKVFWNVDGQPWVKAPFVNEAGESQTAFVLLQ